MSAVQDSGSARTSIDFENNELRVRQQGRLLGIHRSDVDSLEDLGFAVKRKRVQRLMRRIVARRRVRSQRRPVTIKSGYLGGQHHSARKDPFLLTRRQRCSP
ncbi:MAG: hypothetical protein AAGJ40_19030 [Planctomycetota bacterium]